MDEDPRLYGLGVPLGPRRRETKGPKDILGPPCRVFLVSTREGGREGTGNLTGEQTGVLGHQGRVLVLYWGRPFLDPATTSRIQRILLGVPPNFLG